LVFGSSKGAQEVALQIETKYFFFSFFFSSLFDNVDAAFHEWYLRETNMFGFIQRGHNEKGNFDAHFLEASLYG
jgi:hypothetical protein